MSIRFSIKSQLQQILCVLGMYALFDAHETSHCSFSVSQVLCTNWRFLLRYSWLVTRVKFSSRRWGQDSPSKAPTMSLSLRQSLQDLSVERAIDVIDRMGAVTTCQSSCCDAGFFVDKHSTLFNPGIQRCPSDSGFTVNEVKIYILMAMPPGCFGFQYPSKFKLVSSCGSLPWRRIPTDLFLWLVIDVLLLLSRLWTLFMPSSRSQHAPSATSDTIGSITYYSATRVRISNTHLWRFWRCWSRHKCSTGSFAWARGVVSALFESCCWSEYIGNWSDGFR